MEKGMSCGEGLPLRSSQASVIKITVKNWKQSSPVRRNEGALC
jgi:hypothetical protein